MNFYSTFCKAQEEWFVRNQVCCDINIHQGNSNRKWQINMIPWMQAAVKVSMRLLLLAQEVLLEDLEDLRRPWFEKIYRPKMIVDVRCYIHLRWSCSFFFSSASAHDVSKFRSWCKVKHFLILLKLCSSAGSRQMLSRQLRPSRSVAIVLSPTQPVINLEEAMYILAALFKVVQDQF